VAFDTDDEDDFDPDYYGDDDYADDDYADYDYAGDGYADDGYAGDSAKPGISLKWGLGAVIVLALVAIVLVGVVLFGGDTGKNSTGVTSPTTTPQAEAAKVPSADDDGAVTVLTEDRSCAAWTSIENNLVDTLEAIGGGKWSERDRSIPASEWTDEQRKLNMAAAQVIRNTAARTVGLAKLTPHRMMRELYEQYIAYARAYAERVPKYTPADDTLASTAHSAASALASICTSITDGSAAERGSLVDPATPPTETAPPENPNNPELYLASPNPICSDWKSATDKFAADTAEWNKLDPNTAATFWTQQQKSANLAVASVMINYSNKIQQLGRRSQNPVLQDFADVAAQYRRAFVLALPTYEPADQHLANAATYTSMLVLGACKAAGPPA
jgi:hypothetical protein